MTDTGQPRPRRKRILLNILLLLVLLLLLAALALIHTPAFYRRAEDRDMTVMSQYARQFNYKVQDFASEVISSHPSHLILTENDINGCLTAASDDKVWQELSINIASLRRVLTSRALRNLQVVIRDGEAILAGETTIAGFDVVVSLSIIPHVAEDGSVLLRMERPYAGAIPLGQSFLDGLSERIENGEMRIAPSSRWRVKSLELMEGKLVIEGEPAQKSRQPDE